MINHIRQVFNWLNATLNLSSTTIDYTETFYITGLPPYKHTSYG
ncbi:hypothetical protein MICAE_860010 [Microcystis aeruginosa PCC 9806]|uniref:Uncharacterized protein n=1 Tax=Microcystis aeruginosa PCC 9806 TaxID=1160282 RepID=I4H2Z6_MICAE|nr:hypothetical protein MICAE_860010 [Microcystis aeruginosa PCC 9806]